jgi:glutamyl-tRNA reductase
MSLLACGLNYKTTPIEIREKFNFSRERMTSALKEFVEETKTKGAVILSTCNRTEVYTEGQSKDVISGWLSRSCGLSLSTLSSHLYVYEDHHTVKHALRVASGIDSMILGETQVFGQLKEAVHIAEQAGTLGISLRRLFDHVFSVAKEVRTTTEIGANPVSLGYAVMQLAKNIFSHLNNCRILFVGAGEVVESISKYLYDRGFTNFLVANRTVSKDILPVQIPTISLQEIPTYLHEADIVISAVHNLIPIIGKGMAETAIKQRKQRPMLMIDLAVPRNIEKEIKKLQDVYLYDIDDMKYILEESWSKKKELINKAESIIQSQTEHFFAELNVLKISNTLSQYRQKMNGLRDEIIKDAMHELETGNPPQEVIQKMAYQLSNKFLHDPCVWIREAALRDKWDIIEIIKECL